MATPELPEPMNSSPYHSKVKITTTLSDPTFVAGNFVSGKLDMECRADRGLGIGILMVELFAIQELSSRDHSATSTFLHSRRLFQGPGLPPSNAVQAYPMLGDPPLPQHYYQARRGKSTFLFRIPIPTSSPSSISFGSGLAKVRYELRASVGVYWKNEKKLVVDNKTVDVVEAYPYDKSPPEAIVVGDNGKLWMQGRMIGGPVVAGGMGYLELQVKNHSNKKNSSLTLTLTRTLYLPGQQLQQPATVQISDTLTTVPFRGPEYIIPPGAEGVANLVFDVPKLARGVQGGTLDGESKEEGGQPRRTESLFEIRCEVEVKLGMGIGSKDIILQIPIDVVHPMAVPQQPILDPFIQQQPTPYTYANHGPVLERTPYADYTSYYPNQGAYIDPTQIQPWLPPMEPPLLLPQAYPHGYVTSPGPQLLPPFQQFHPMQAPANAHTPPPPHSFFPEALPGSPPVALSYLPPISYQTPIVESLPEPVFVHGIPPTVTPPMDSFFNPVPNPSSNAVLYSPRPQLTPKHSFTRDPALGSLTISKSERVEELEKMADEVAKRSRDLSGDLPKATGAATLEGLDGEVNWDYLNNKTLPGPPVPSGKLGGRGRMGWDNGDDVISTENHDHEEPQQGGRKRRDLMSMFPAAVHDLQAVQARDYYPQEPQQPTGGVTYQTPPTPTLMAVLGPLKQTLPTVAKMGKTPPELLTSESGLDALERRLLAEVGTRKHLEAWDNTSDNNIITEASEDENEENGGRRRGVKTKALKDHQLGRRDVRDVLLSPTSPAAVKATVVGNGNPRLAPIDTDLNLDLEGREEGADSGGGAGGVGGNGASAPIPIPMKSPDPLNESAISSLTLGGEGLASGLPDTGGTGAGFGLGFSNGGGAAGATGDSDGEGDGEADFDGRTHRAGSASLSEGSNSGSDRMVLGARSGGGGLHRHTRQRAEVSTPTEMIAQERGKPRRGGGGGVETKEKFKSSSSKKKDRLNGIGNGSGETKKSRNKSSAAAKGRVAAWLGGIDSAVPPQEEIIPPSPSVVRDLDGSLFEDEQRAAVQFLGRSPLSAALPLFPLSPNSASPTTPGGVLTTNVRIDLAANGGADVANENIKNEDKVASASPNPRSSGFVSITTLKRDPISLPSPSSIFRKPLLLSRDATVIDEARRVQDLWSSTPPGITADKDLPKSEGTAGAMSSISHERINRKASPSSLFSKPAGVVPLSYSAAVASAPAPGPSAAAAAAAPRNVWKTADQKQSSTSQSKGRQLPPSTTKPSGYKPPGGKLPVFPPSKPPIDPQVKYDIRSARGGRGGKVASVASLWASGAINNQSRQTTTTAAAANNHIKDKVKEVPKRLPNGVEEVSDSLPTLPSKPARAEKKLFSAAVMTPAPVLKNVRAYTPTVLSGNSGGSGGSGGPKKMTSTPTLPVPSVGVLAGAGKVGKVAAASRSTDNVVAVQKRPVTTTTPTINFFQGGKTTPTANLSTPSSSSGPPAGRLHDLPTTKRGVGGTKGIGKAAVTGPPGVLIKATSDPAVISSSLAVPTLSSTASLVRPHHQNSKQDNHRHHPQPRVAVVKLPTTFASTTPGSGLGGSGSGSRSGSSVSPRPGSPQVAVANNNTDSKPTELAFGQARLRDLIKKYQGSSPASVGQKA
ncbi:hypothetical protein BYT27DRAFT_7227437 [Phlegmacium glaucopus]|nr:hypothetical protein BYT27DRAFT_7227437 [Phlegmacium glaucopus]